MKETMILYPLELFDYNEDAQKKLKDNYEKVRCKLEDIYQNLIKQTFIYMSYDQFLVGLNLSNDDYINCIRYSLKRPTVFLKRETNEISINAYNYRILNILQANMDIQFIIDPYACISYIIDYINKSDRGMSTLLRRAVKEVKKGNFSIRQKFNKIGSTFINASEISAQEATFMMLSLKLSRASEKVFLSQPLLQKKE
jgi:hypothetical protein